MNKNKPLVSVIITAYNRADTICDAIDSVINQTYKNIEIIVIDDGSKDDTKEKLFKYGDNIIYIYKENGGFASALNKGIIAANGKYIAILDSDDTWYLDKIEKQTAKLEQIPDDYALVISEIEAVDNNRGHKSFTNIRKTIVRDGKILQYLFELPPMTCSFIFAKREAVLKIGLFDETFKTAVDFDFMLRICSKYKVALIDEPLVKYKSGEDSISHSLFSGNRLKAIKKFEQIAPELARRHSQLVTSARAKIHLSYADDLLWNRHVKEARKQIMRSLANKFTLNAIVFFIKCCIIQIAALFLKQYKDKGDFSSN